MIIIDHININSVRYKFESLFDLVNTNLDVLVISETKTDEMFQESQFIIEGFHWPYSKWWRGSLVCKGRCSYNAHRGEIISHLDTIGNILDKVCRDYWNSILLGDFKVETKEKHMSEFKSVHNLKNLIKRKTCFKNPKNSSCIDQVLTNCRRILIST